VITTVASLHFNGSRVTPEVSSCAVGSWVRYAGQPGCSLPSGASGAGVELEEGLTPGWDDVYTWDTPSQLIDITNVAPGRYALIEQTNPSNTILVAGPMQTCAVTELTLTADTVTATRSIPSAPCPA
jgi:hypothetical protein